MSKIEPIGNWSSKAALADAMDALKDHPEAEVIIIFRKTEKNYVGMRSANSTNATVLWMIEEFKHDLFNKCHQCQCEQNEE